MRWIKPVMATFGIGVTAGVAPFMFMQLLPAMLNPEAPIVAPNYLAMVLIALLIGTITSIVFAKHFATTEPREIFVYALGVPAVLIATTTNISTVFKAKSSIAEVRERASAALLPATPEAIDQQPTELPATPSDSPAVHTLAARWLEASLSWNAPYAGEPDTVYLVVIGEYSTAGQARADYAKYRNVQLQTERYAPKNLGVYELRSNSFILAYARYNSAAEATRVYQLLRINDPEVSVRILMYPSPRRS